jgi:uncharacterized protein (TIGR00369 family)
MPIADPVAGPVPGSVAGGGEWFVPERERLANCFGCGPANVAGLRLRFRRCDDGDVETRPLVAARFEGVDDVVHGGIQTTILDEVMGVAAQLSLPASASAAPCVTAELAVRFLRPVPVGEVWARARVVRRHGRDIYVHAELLAPDATSLTTARSRWRQLGD